MQHPVLIIRLCNIIRLIKNGWLCICHGYAKSCGLDHGQVVVSISAADHFICSKTDACQ